MLEIDAGTVMLGTIVFILTLNIAQFLVVKIEDCSLEARRFYYIVGSIVAGIGLWAQSYVIILAHKFPAQLSMHYSPILFSFVCSVLVFTVLLHPKKKTLWSTIALSLLSGVLVVFVSYGNIGASIGIRLANISPSIVLLSILACSVATFAFFLFKAKSNNNLTSYSLRSLVLGVFLVLPMFGMIVGIDFSAYDYMPDRFENELNISDLKVTIAVFVTILLLAFLSIIMSRDKLRPTLSMKIGVLIGSMLIIVILITGTTIYSLIESMKLEEFSEVSRDTINYESNYFERISKDLSEEMILLSHQSALQRYFLSESNKENTRNEIVEMLSKYMRNNESVWQARLIDVPGSGRELIRVQRFNDDIFAFNDKDLQLKAHRDYYQKTVLLKAGEIYVSDVTLNREKGAIELPHRPTFRIATPIYQVGKKLLGIMVINIDFQALVVGLRNNIDFPMMRYVINERGDFLLHPDANMTFASELNRSVSVSDQLPEIVHLQNNETTRLFPKVQGTTNGKKLIVAQKSYYVPNDKSRWIVFVGVVESFVLDNVKQSFIVKFVQLCSVFSLVALAIVIALSRYIVRPVVSLSAAYKLFAEEKRVTETKAYQDDEIGDLSHSFYDLCMNVNRNEAALTEKTEFLNTILQHTYDGIIVIDDEGIMHNVNKAAEKMFLCREQDMLGRNINELLPMPIRKQHDQYIKNYLKTGEAKIIGNGREVEAYRSNNEKINIELGITELVQQGKRYFVGTLKDITQKKIAEEELKKRQLELSSILDTAVDGIFTVNDMGLVATANPAAHKILGYQQEALFGEAIQSILPEVADFGAAMIQKTIIGSSNETTARHKDGNVFPIELSVSETRFGGRVVLTCIIRDITERKNQELALNDALMQLRQSKEQLLVSNKELEKTTRIDPLTQIANRRYFDEVYEREFKRGRRNQNTLGILMIDVDHFKAYNDFYGHQQGDECLKSVARVINESVRRPADLVARYGGEEFIVLMPETDREGLIIIAENISQTLRALRIEHEGSPVAGHVTISIGAFLVIPQQFMSKAELIKRADEALYDAKELGRNQVVFKDAA